MAVLVLGACSLPDSSTGPSSRDGLRTLLASGEVASAPIATPAPADTGRATFTIDPAGDTIAFGPHMIAFSRHAVCDPERSTYGPTEWLRPCEPLTVAQRVDVKWWVDSRGHARAEFEPALRFNPDAEVWLFFHDPKGAPLPTTALLYCPEGSGFCFNESAGDPVLRTYRDPSVHCVYRRLRHFSGYNVWA